MTLTEKTKRWDRQRDEAIRRFKRLPTKVQKRRRSRWYKDQKRLQKSVKNWHDRYWQIGNWTED